MRALDIAICGCGPGGLATALRLHRSGHRVRLIERFAEPRALGSGLILQPVGLAVLRALGLEPSIRALGHRIDRLEGRTAHGGRLVLAVDFGALGGRMHALAVHRGALFGVLYDAVIAAGIPIEHGIEVREVDGSGGRPWVLDRAGRRLGPFDLVVDALGSRSSLAQRAFGEGIHRPLAYGALWASLPWPGRPFLGHALEQRYEKASVMIGVLPIGRRAVGGPEETAFFWSLKPVQYADWRRQGLEAWKARVRGLWPETEALLSAIAQTDQLVLASYGHHTLRRPLAEGLAIIGDAAHSTSPQLGQGANMALLDAMALGSALDHSAGVGEALHAYARMRRLHVRLYQRLSALFTPVYQSDSRLLPWLRDGLFASVSRLPGASHVLASLVAGQWGAPLAALGLRQRPEQVDTAVERA